MNVLVIHIHRGDRQMGYKMIVDAAMATLKPKYIHLVKKYMHMKHCRKQVGIYGIPRMSLFQFRIRI